MTLDDILARAEGDLAIARELVKDKRKAKDVSRLLAGVVGGIENVRLDLARPALKHCPAHDDYKDSCHDCYQAEYGRLKGGERGKGKT